MKRGNCDWKDVFGYPGVSLDRQKILREICCNLLNAAISYLNWTWLHTTIWPPVKTSVCRHQLVSFRRMATVDPAGSMGNTTLFWNAIRRHHWTSGPGETVPRTMGTKILIASKIRLNGSIPVSVRFIKFLILWRATLSWYRSWFEIRCLKHCKYNYS